MASNLAVGVIIGASVAGSFKTAFGSAQKTSEALGRTVGRATQQQQCLLAKINAGPQRGLNSLIQQYEGITRQINRTIAAQQRLDRAIASRQAGSEHRAGLRGQMRETAGHALAMGMPIYKSVQAFMAQEEAATSLRIAMMKSDGSVGAFKALSREVVELGKLLPGTTSDFYQLATALKEQGVSDDKLKGGALRQSAGLNIVMEMDQRSGGEFFAKMLEAHGLEERDFGKAADLTQRAKFAFGMNKDDMFQSMKYYAPTTGVLGLKGVENYEKLLALQGMGAQVGLEGSSFGTNFAMMLTRLVKGPKMIDASNKGMKAEAREVMDKSKVRFHFFDKKGNFKGLEEMVGELEKLKKVKADQGEAAALLLAGEMFGAEAARPALIMAEKGREGMAANLKLMRDQADLEQRIKEKTSTLSAALEQLGGVAEHAFGSFGSAFAKDIESFANKAQGFIENTLQPWIMENKGLILTVVKVAGGLLAFKLGMLGVMYATSLAISPFKSLWVASARLNALWEGFKLWRMSGGAAKLAGALSKLGSVFGWLGKVFMMAGRAVLFIGRALLMNPLGLIITGIAVAAFLIWKYWEPIKGFFVGLWNGVTAVFDSAWNSIKTAFDGGIAGISALIVNWSPLGLFYQAFRAVMSWFGVELPNTFTGFGSMIIHGLINGLKAKFAELQAWWSEKAAWISQAFTSTNQIRSPSRLFMQHGGHIVEGLALGLANSVPKASAAVAALSERLTLDASIAAKVSPVAVAGVGAGAATGGVTIHFSPTIHAGGEAGAVQNALKLSLRELEVMLKQLKFDQQRRSFA